MLPAPQARPYPHRGYPPRSRPAPPTLPRERPPPTLLASASAAQSGVTRPRRPARPRPLPGHTLCPALRAGPRLRSSPVRLPASGSALRAAADPKGLARGGGGGSVKRPAGHLAEVSAAGRARGERSSRRRPWAPGSRRWAPGGGLGRETPGAAVASDRATCTPRSWRLGRGAEAAPSVQVGAVWPLRRCRRCPPATYTPQTLGGATSPAIREEKVTGLQVQEQPGRTGDVVLTITTTGTGLRGEVAPRSGRPPDP